MRANSERLVTGREKPPPRYIRRFAVPRKLRASRDPMFEWMAEGNCKKVVEVGTQWGWWAYRALTQLPEIQLWCVDPWQTDRESVRHWHGAFNRYEWQDNLSSWLGGRAFGLHGTSKDVVGYFRDEELDCVFIDGDHSTKGVVIDLKLWVPKVRNGGLILGHDWDGIWGKQVRAGVVAYFGDSCPIDADIGYLTKKGKSAVWKVKKTWD